MAPSLEPALSPAGSDDVSSIRGDSSLGLHEKTAVIAKENRTQTPSLLGGSQAGSDDSDPLEPLEHGLARDLEIEAGYAARRESLTSSLAHTRTRTSIASAASRLPDFEVAFGPDDPDNPRNWPLWYKAWVIFGVSFSTWVVVLYSTSYTATIPGVMGEFHVDSQPVATLGLTTYLLGLAAGTVVVAPMSELYGRRPVYLICLFIFTLLIIPCGLATSLSEIIVVRFFGALFGAAMVSNSPGTVVDIADHEYIALCMSLWSIAPLNGPVTGPLIGGFVYQYLGWRWANWIALILGGASFCIMVLAKETYAPVILQKRAAKKRKEENDERWWCRYDEKRSTLDLLKVNMSRPFVLAVTEPILICFNVWITVIYSILYLCFVAYPIVFVEHRGWAPGISGLAFIGIGIGTMLAIVLEPVWRRMINSNEKDPETGKVFPEAMGAVMSIGGILVPVGQLVFSWTCLPTSIHWAIPIAFGIPFGMGNTLVFIYSSNYLAGSYGLYAASALAGNTVMRSVFGATIPLAGKAMYDAMTPQWAGTLLGLLEAILIPIPFIFSRYGARIRAKSRVIQQMRRDQERNQSKRARQLARAARRAAAEDPEGDGDPEKSLGGKTGVVGL
ncbi:polyamine transporter 3 [Lasiosphaeria ovina]|uniref:Polyamine transporter 3 n=1 Tax=Lasiosphaeria ovina TaxID=92902 RepID=A0AAE0KIV6_9PEZI|nr:polyamine transporter 3 [Lasiosphaeria ovina]